MSLHAWRSWLKRSFGATPGGRRHPDPRRRTRPTLEVLENRLALAMIAVTSTADASNYSPSTVTASATTASVANSRL